MKRLNVGVIGLGLIGAPHARIYHELPNANLVGVADIDEGLAKRLAREYGCDAYTDYNDLLKRPDLDAVSICVPEELHVAPAVAAAKAGKHILMEKPIAKTVKEALEITSAAEKAGVRLMVGQTLRWDPRYVGLHDSIARGDLGEPIFLRLKRTNPYMSAQRLKGRVSIFYFLGVHDIDAIRWFAGSDITRAYAQRVTKMHASIESEDAVVATFNFANGAVGTVELAWSLPKSMPTVIVAAAEVIGTKGAGYVQVFDGGLQVYLSEPPAGAQPVSFPDTFYGPEVHGTLSGVLRDEIAHFVQKTLDGGDYCVPTLDTVKAVAAIEACFESIRTGMPATLKF